MKDYLILFYRDDSERSAEENEQIRESQVRFLRAWARRVARGDKSAIRNIEACGADLLEFGRGALIGQTTTGFPNYIV